HVVDVALANACRRDLDELRLDTHFVDGGAAGEAHAGAHAAGQLEDNGRHRTFVGHPALDTFRHQLAGTAVEGLEVAVAGTVVLGHRTQRSHAAVGLVAATLVELDFARGFL